MDEPGSRETLIALRDGTRLSIGEREIRLGERAIPLSSLEEARLTATQPETITLRAQGIGVFEAQPAQPGDGAIALEAIYRVRADLRPFGYGFPPPPPGYPPVAYPMPGFAPPPGYSYAPPMPTMGGYPPPMYPPAYPPPFPYGVNPNVGRGEITVVPRTFEQTIDATFRLYFKHWRRWLALGALVALLPALLYGAAQLTFYRMFGLPQGRLSGATGFGVNSGQTPQTLRFPDHAHLVADGALLLATVILILIFSAWQTASLALGSRDALFGRPVSPAAAVRNALSRLGATLGANIVLALVALAALSPMFACLGVILVTLSRLSTEQGGPPSFSGPFATIALFSLLAIVLAIPGVILAALFGVRLGLAPYIAATEELGSGAALKKSWRLTQGHFWRAFGVYVVVGLAVGLVSGLVTLIAQQFSPLVDLLLITPLLTVVTAPFTALATTTLLFDLRLRREGYPGMVAGHEGTHP